MATPVQANLEAKNKEYAAKFTKGSLALPPAKHYTVVTCMDARIEPFAAFGIDLGDAHVIRNAGASAKDAFRSIIISEQLLGTKEVLIIKHTGCGMLTFENKDAHGLIQKNVGADASHIDFLPFKDLETAVKDDIAYLKGSKLIPDDITISGWVYDVTSGKVSKVE
ncbi:MAG: hypothetical protein M1824_003912 [Vezdaea acicularis]|nr:MAG: hypothetical protein M1824_003912 [Vezdaea acicularis]